MRESVGAPVYGYYRPDEALPPQASHQARASLGADSYDDHLDTGRSFDLDDAVAHALELPPPSAVRNTE